MISMVLCCCCVTGAILGKYVLYYPKSNKKTVVEALTVIYHKFIHFHEWIRVNTNIQPNVSSNSL